MNRRVDYHGYTTEEVVSDLLNQIFSIREEGGGKLEIITGKGMGTLFAFVTKLLEEENLKYREINPGLLLVIID